MESQNTRRKDKPKFLRSLTDTAIDIASKAGQSYAETELEKLCRISRKRNIVTAALNTVTLILLVLSAVFTGQLQGKTLFILSALNLILLARAALNLSRFLFTVVKPYYKVISVSLPCFFRSLVKQRSPEQAIKTTIKTVCRFYYTDKVPGLAQTAHKFASLFDLVQSPAEIEDKAARDFYPLVKKYIIQGMMLNIALFVVCYGIFIVITKQIIFQLALHMTVWKVLFYVFRANT
ncbi:hypothetical protein AGMMS49944_10480 [Spirochaetia bacterium]|nr:hypothetical protein AGMMS49944_10480 [Spirochaetia bacterium]